MACWCVISLRWCHIMAVHKCCTFCLKQKKILSPTPVAHCPLLALRGIQLMTGEPRPRYGALQLLGKSRACALERQSESIKLQNPSRLCLLFSGHCLAICPFCWQWKQIMTRFLLLQFRPSLGLDPVSLCFSSVQCTRIADSCHLRRFGYHSTL